MKTIFEHIRERLIKEPPKPIDAQIMRETQWEPQFIEYMRNRMVFGGYRYGLIRDSEAPQTNNIGSILKRARKYLIDGNKEHLVDIANLALVEFVREACHPDPHWSPVDDGEHTEIFNKRNTR